jgi:hypothetical protein
MPVARANHCSAVVGDYLLVIGGNHKDGADFVKTAEVHAARRLDDGTLGPWIVAGALPSGVTECTATAHGTTLVVIDGLYDDETDERKVLSAEIASDGSLGAWTTLGDVPQGQRFLSSEAFVNESTLYVMGSKLPDAGDVTVTYRADLTSGLGEWKADDWLPGFRGQPQYAFSETFAYVIGGYSGGAGMVLSNVDGAPIGADGVVGPGSPMSPLPVPRAFGEACVVDGYIFFVGGKPAISAPGESNVLSAAVADEGAITIWTEQTSLPAGRTNHDMAVGGDYLYVTGGATDGPGLATVFAARIRH